MRKITYFLMFLALSAASFCSSATELVSTKISGVSASALSQSQDLNAPLILEKSDAYSKFAAHYSHSSHVSHGSHMSHSSHTSHFSSRY